MEKDMEKLMNMSLDEYIASKKPSTPAAGGLSEELCRAGSSCSEGKFKAERRWQKRAEEAEDDDDDDVALVVDMEEDELGMNDSSRTELNTSRNEKSFGIWRGPTYTDLDHMEDEPKNLINDPIVQQRPVHKAAGQLQQKPVADLRSRITSTAASCTSTSQQWRLRRPNVTSPVALLNQSNMQNGLTNTDLTWDGLKRRRWKNRPRRRNGNGNGGGIFGGGIGGQPGNGNWSNNGGPYINHNHNNNGRVQRSNPNYSQEMLNKNINAVLERINNTNRNINNNNNFNCNKLFASRTGSVRGLSIERPGVAINLSPNRLPQQLKAQQPPRPLLQQLQAQEPPKPLSQVDTQQPQQSQTPLNQGLKALLGVSDNSFKTEMMPMLASKFLDFLQNGAQQTMHKPIYDMQIQKEIHQLQKKPLMYKCPSGEVVSSDGAGIEGCSIVPCTSGVTLNYRFG